MSIHNEDEFKIEQNDKIYSINISIEEDQLYLVLTLYSNPPKKYSGFFSLNELRISSKIFNHTKTLFEAKEIVKRTVIKKQLLIEENEHKANITFDIGLGHDSVPFPIILFRDSNEKHPNKSLLNNISDNPKDNDKRKSNINKSNKYSTVSINNNQNNNNDVDSNNTINIVNLRASIGNNINNKMLNQNQSRNEEKYNLGNIEFNNSMKRFNVTNNLLNKNNNTNNNVNSQKSIFNPNNFYKKVDFINNVNNMKGNTNKDYIALNNNILYNIYHNMNNANNVNSSFYRNLQNSFTTNDNMQKVENNPINNNVNNNLRKNIRNIDNNSLNQPYIFTQQNLNNIPKPTILRNIYNQQLNANYKVKYIPNNYMNNNNYNNLLNKNNMTKKILKNNQIHQQIKQNMNNPLINSNIVSHNKSFNTAPIQKNLTKIPNRDNLFLNKNINFENNKIKTFNNPQDNNKKRLSISSSSEENENMDENIEEFDQREQPYRFKNLTLKGSKKIKGNLEKFKENQNMGDYVPSGTKFVSYLKFPDTKINTNLSLTASTISSSLTSGSNRIVGIEKNIIKNPGELEEITSKLQRILNKRNIKYKLLYKATVDGDSSTKFHEKCDKIINTLILIHASEDKRFGGFTTQTWDGEYINKKDNNCFIFSIDKMKIYEINENQNAINCNPDLGPIFINQIKLLDKFFTQGGTTSKGGKTFSTLEDFEITGGAEKFGVKEVEVYQVK